jgi:hypothetical protein
MPRKRPTPTPRKKTLNDRRTALWLKQSGFCALCNKPLDYEESCLDHDHSCCDKPVRNSCGSCDRGVLHGMCNALLGFGNDDIELLELAIKYLRERDI